MAELDKREALKSWTGSESDQNRLFFQARNLAIESLCLRIENRCLRAGLPVQVEWKESSFPSVSLRFTLTNPKKGQSWTELTTSVLLKRSRISAPASLSECYYEYQGNVLGCASGRVPALLVQLTELIQEMITEGELARIIAGANYPFDYKPLSVF